MACKDLSFVHCALRPGNIMMLNITAARCNKWSDTHHLFQPGPLLMLLHVLSVCLVLLTPSHLCPFLYCRPLFLCDPSPHLPACCHLALPLCGGKEQSPGSKHQWQSVCHHHQDGLCNLDRTQRICCTRRPSRGTSRSSAVCRSLCIWMAANRSWNTTEPPRRWSMWHRPWQGSQHCFTAWTCGSFNRWPFLILEFALLLRKDIHTAFATMAWSGSPALNFICTEIMCSCKIHAAGSHSSWTPSFAAHDASLNCPPLSTFCQQLVSKSRSQ